MIREIVDFNEEAIFVNKILEGVRDECLFSQYSYNTLEKYRNSVKAAFINNIDDIETCSVDELGDFVEILTLEFEVNGVDIVYPILLEEQMRIDFCAL